jgi:hypothetical protein
VTEAPEVSVAKIIGEEENDIGRCCRRSRFYRKQCEQDECTVKHGYGWGERTYARFMATELKPMRLLNAMRLGTTEKRLGRAEQKIKGRAM